MTAVMRVSKSLGGTHRQRISEIHSGSGCTGSPVMDAPLATCFLLILRQVRSDASGNEGGAGGVAGADVAPVRIRDRVGSVGVADAVGAIARSAA